MLSVANWDAKVSIDWKFSTSAVLMFSIPILLIAEEFVVRRPSVVRGLAPDDRIRSPIWSQ